MRNSGASDDAETTRAVFNEIRHCDARARAAHAAIVAVKIAIADAENRLEGISRSPETDAVFDAYVRGDIEVTEMVPRLKALLGIN